MHGIVRQSVAQIRQTIAKKRTDEYAQSMAGCLPGECARFSASYAAAAWGIRMTVVDRLGIAGNRRNSAIWSEVIQRGKLARICWAIDIGRWKAALFRALES
jgi:hypothetical protein